MKKLTLAIVVVAALYFVLEGQSGVLRQPAGAPTTQARAVSASQNEEIPTAFAEQKSGTQVTGEGRPDLPVESAVGA